MTSEDNAANSPVIPSPSLALTPFEREQIRAERLKAWLSAGTIAASVLAALVAYMSAQSTQKQQALDAFQLKAAEIVMASRTAWEARDKARALAAFFPKNVPPSMADTTRFDPVKHGWGRESHRELLTLLLTAPSKSAQQRAIVLETWKAFFPGDTWVDSIRAAP